MIAGMAIVTYLTRAPLLVLLRGDLPPWLRRWLKYVPIAVFAGLIVPAFVAPQGVPTVQIGLLVGLVGAVTAWRTGQLYFTVLAGLAIFWVFRLLQ